MKSILKTDGPVQGIPLSELPIGRRGRLCAPPENGEVSRRLGDLGFVPGTVVTVVRRAPLGDPVELDLRGYRLCLRLEQLAGLRVELDPAGDGA